MALKVVGSNPIIHPIKNPEAFASGIFYGVDNGIRRGRPERSEGKKHAGGMFFSPGENPGAFDGIPVRGCWQMRNRYRSKKTRGFRLGYFLWGG